MIYYPIKEPSGFKTFKTIRVLGENTYSGKIIINEANEELAGLIDNILNFNGKARPKNKDDKKKNKWNFLNPAKNLYQGIELVINAFKSGLFPL